MRYKIQPTGGWNDVPGASGTGKSYTHDVSSFGAGTKFYYAVQVIDAYTYTATSTETSPLTKIARPILSNYTHTGVPILQALNSPHWWIYNACRNFEIDIT